ncbi:MAG: hypothetical protein HC920_21675 [Oscillatoriales cyanobacterium SM2_3_0]|nr:hypothetical protein [Oscillatoriales cyanobacterium SM2_3_0]
MTQRPPQQSILSFLNRSRRRDVELDQTHAPRSGANASNGLNTSSSRSSPIGSNPSNSPLDYSSTPSGRRRYSGQTSQNGQNGSQKTVPPSLICNNQAEMNWVENLAETRLVETPIPCQMTVCPPHTTLIVFSRTPNSPTPPPLFNSTP